MLLIEDLVHAYTTPTGERHEVLRVPRFALAAGAQMALEGESGSGKTTLLHLIAGLAEPESGAVTIAGERMTGRGEAARDALRARLVGYVYQSFNLLQGFTTLENVLLGMAFGPGQDEAWARHLLDRVGLSDRLDYRPRELSVGQQQRVSLARALANRPKLVLADEPTGNLDRARAEEALGLLRSLCTESNAALLLVSHDPAVLGAFDRRESLAVLSRPEVAAR
ncbi:MAG: ABC transporter ATP-binding protein [Candidatus Sumerlaeia bacterium]|nr:ABC transporter ATP-binding protein [Candidatus Sumerlaeia bacterium]